MKNRVFSAYTYLKTRLFTASVFFTLAVILFGAATYIQLPCPVCGGTGYITGVGNLEVIEIKSELIEHEVVGLECGWDFETYKYDITMLVENNTGAPLYGLVEITFHDPDSTRIVYIEVDDEVEEAVEIAGGIIAADTIFIDEMTHGTEAIVEATIVFDGISLEQLGVETHLVKVHAANEFICPFHDEGEAYKVTLTEWLRLR